jgi:hypothetical protein
MNIVPTPPNNISIELFCIEKYDVRVDLKILIPSFVEIEQLLKKLNTETSLTHSIMVFLFHLFLH